jgi:hypothetical protein
LNTAIFLFSSFSKNSSSKNFSLPITNNFPFLLLDRLHAAKDLFAGYATIPELKITLIFISVDSDCPYG